MRLAIHWAHGTETAFPSAKYLGESSSFLSKTLVQLSGNPCNLSHSRGVRRRTFFLYEIYVLLQSVPVCLPLVAARQKARSGALISPRNLDFGRVFAEQFLKGERVSFFDFSLVAICRSPRSGSKSILNGSSLFLRLATTYTL